MPKAESHPRTKAARELEKQLARYRSMRDFGVTAEPRGAGRATESTSLPFVIQKHAATRLHYDFRLGWNGVLKSWAVTKGPSLYPADKRLAVQVEDHPLEYGDFEGTIPKGQYGGGTVMVWDYGRWEPLEDVDRGLEKGHLKFNLYGTRLQGRFALVRMHTRDERPDKPNWLLVKDRDEFARSEQAQPITEEAPDSAVSNRTIEQIAQDNDRTWHSNKARDGTPLKIPSAPPKTPSRIPSLNAIPEEKFPGFIAPQLAKQCSSPPAGDEWIHELKLDGYRIQIHVRRSGKQKTGEGPVGLFTRKGLDWTRKMPDIAGAAQDLPVQSAILDGEVVVLDAAGTSSFAELQAAFQEGKKVQLTYFAFDLLHLNGRNLRGLPLVRRKDLLKRLLSRTPSDFLINFSEHFHGNGVNVFRNACALGAEGIVSKLASASYDSVRGASWLKSKCGLEQEFVIGGFSDTSNGSPGIGALLIGYFDGPILRYAGRSGTGFTQQSRLTLRKRLEKLEQSKPPFERVPREAAKGAHWVQPKLVAQIAFATWTRDDLVRQASFKGLREDKPASEVVRETAIEPDSAPEETPQVARKKSQPSSTRARSAIAANFAITHPDKVLDSASGTTKRNLADYYVAVADHILPHVADRPLSIVRCPEGTGKQCFFQKHIGQGMPNGVRSVPVPDKKTGKIEDYLTLNTAEGLAGLAQMGVLEIHPWGSKNDSLENPDRIVFDLDPDTAIDWRTLTKAAIEFRSRLKALGLESFVKTTGGKGLHVVVAVQAEHPWSIVKQFAHKIVSMMEKDEPNLYVVKMAKAIRKDRIFLDYLRNDRGSTAVAPFSPRARQGMPAAVPLHWKELGSQTRPTFAVSDFPSWKNRLANDPWLALSASKQRLTPRVLSDLGIQRIA
jgi:bifunctional non-homologous end joining protein LigD